MKKRKIGLSIVIVLLALSNFAGIFKLKLTAEQLSQLYTFLSPDEIMWLAIIPVVTIISLFAIWFGKRWGIIMAVIVFTVTLFLDVYYQVWAHALLATAGFVLLMFFCWQSRQFFSLEKYEEPEK
jgi:hypothetical protein